MKNAHKPKTTAPIKPAPKIESEAARKARIARVRRPRKFVGRGEHDPIPWGGEKAPILYWNARSAMVLADPIWIFFRQLSSDEAAPRFVVGDKTWFGFYDNPRAIVRVILDDTGKLILPGEGFSLHDWYMAFLKQLARFNKKSQFKQEQLVRRFLQRNVGDLQDEGVREQWNEGALLGKELVEDVTKARQAEDRNAIRGNVEELSDSELEALDRNAWQWFMFVCLPCWVLYQAWPHHLLRAAKKKSPQGLAALGKLMTVDKRIQYHPAIIHVLQQHYFDKPKTYRNRLSKMSLSQIPALDKGEIKLSLIAVVYELHSRMPKTWQRATKDELKALFDAFEEAKSGEKGRLDQNLPKNSPALSEALKERRKRWRSFIDQTLKEF